jgi:protein-S-isoprenylcysteine O-methyltransferase Ste14
MAKQSLQEQMYGVIGTSRAQRVTLAFLIACCAGVAWWLLFAGGVATIAVWFGRNWPAGDLVRRASLAAALGIYFVRLLFTEFVFLKRGVSWNEVFTIAPWVFCIFVVLGLAAGTNPRPLGIFGADGIALFLLGSWMNSYAEYQRHVWKQCPDHRGRLFTLGLFRMVRHPNYLGDLISFSGVCLIAGRWFTAFIPLLMLCGFVFVNVPVLDAHLREHYGAEFDEYARKTRKLIPFVY